MPAKCSQHEQRLGKASLAAWPLGSNIDVRQSRLRVADDSLEPLDDQELFGKIERAPKAQSGLGNSWRKCHKKAKNVGARFDSNLPSCRNAYKQISELSFGGISVQSKAGFRRTGAERLIRSESLA